MKNNIRSFPIQPSSSPDAVHAPPGSLAFLVGALIAAHASGTMAFIGLPVIAPQIAPAYGLPVYMIGYQASVASLGVVISMLFCSNFASVIGGARTIQIGLGMLAAGVLLALTGSLALLAIGSLAIGFGYGMLTPAGSEMLYRFTPAHRRNLIFSLKQCGVPLGAVLAGTLGPAAATAAGWQAALWLYAALLAGTFVLFQAAGQRWSYPRARSAPLFSAPLRSVRIAWEHPAIRPLTLGCAFLNMVQSVLFAYSVTLFHEDFGVPLIQAGLFLSVAQVGGVCGRLAWGWIADRTRDSAGMLIVIAALITLAAIAIGTLPLGWPRAWVFALFFVFGMTGSGWNGLLVAEVARMAPPQQIGLATGGALVYLNIGYIVAPVLFAAVYASVQSYSFCFALLAVPGVLAMTLFVFARRQTRRSPR